MVLTRNDWFRNMRRNMGIYSRPLRNPLIHSRLHSSWLFSCAADGELAHRTTDNENRQEVRRTDGCMIPKGLPGLPRAAPRCRKRSAAESRPPGLETCRNMPIFAPIQWIWNRSIPQICAPIFRGSSLKKRESITLYGQPS